MQESVEQCAQTHYVAPGQLLVSADDCALKTVLGSCVSVCLYDATSRVGGMNHFLLPTSNGAREQSSRYGDFAMGMLLRKLEQSAGSTARELCAGLYGGAKVLAGISELMHLGERNVEFARDWLRKTGIPIVSEDVLGKVARRLEFRVRDGSTRVRLLGAS